MKDVAAHRVQDLPEYVFARLNKAVKEVKESTGSRILDLGAGSPDIPPSGAYRNKFAELVKAEDAHLYPGYGAIDEFSDAIKKWYQTRFNVRLGSNQLLPLNGAKDGIAHLPVALFDLGNEVLVPDPGYPAFVEPAQLMNAKVAAYNLSSEFKLDLSEIENKLTDRSKAIWVNFPSNPTGQAITLPELEQLVTFAKVHNLFVLYDNAYSEITFNGFIAPSILQVPGATDIAIEIGSFSKSFSFAGYRMGWIVGNSAVIAALAKVKSQIDSGMSLPLQRLAAYALTHTDTAWHKKAIGEYQRRRDLIAEHLRTLGLEFSLPSGGLYIWAKLPAMDQNSEQFCLDLLQKRHILLTPGSAFGKNGEGYARASICTNIADIDSFFN